MLFRDFLRAAVMLFGVAGSALAVVAIASAANEDTNAPVYVAVGWWTVAAVAGLWLGRRNAPTAQIGRLLASARSTSTLPEIEPGTIIFNRLWPLAVMTIVSGGIAWLVPQVPAIAAGYAIAIALTWRKQASAVEAIEERDGVRFYFERSSPFGEPKLLRTPGLRKIEPATDFPQPHDAL
jgi:hypothetical protein